MKTSRISRKSLALTRLHPCPHSPGRFIMSPEPSSRSIHTHKTALPSNPTNRDSDVFVKYEGLYQHELIEGRFVFLPFWGDAHAREPAQLSDTFFQKAQELAGQPSSLPNNLEQTITDKAKGQNSCLGWYDTKTQLGAWCSVVVVHNTGAGFPFGTDSIRSDGFSWPGNNWQSTTWEVAAGYSVP